MRTCHQTDAYTRRIVLGFLLGVCGLAAISIQAPAAEASASGEINVIRNANSAFDSYTTGATPEQQQWMRDHYSRMRGYAPYFDRALSWAPPTDFYRDLYAIYTDESTLLSQHPDWVLKDSSGHRLYIPWACNGTSCTQYAADIGDPGFRQFWINEARSDMAKGYKGIFIDDVNLEMKVGNASGSFTRPIDPRTGQAMTETEAPVHGGIHREIRAQISDAHIAHNSLLWMDQNDTYVQREVKAADSIELERGFSDTGLTEGTGKYGFQTLLSHVDWLHSLGKSIILEPYLSTPTQRKFEIASYFLISNGSDSLSPITKPTPIMVAWLGSEPGSGQGQTL